VTRAARIAALVALLVVVLVPRPALASDCSGLTDCYSTIVAGIIAAVAIGLLLFFLWEFLAAAEVGAFLDGAGPWVAEATNITEGGVIEQSAAGSCVSACGEILTDGAMSEAQLLGELGEWSNPGALADALNAQAGSGAWQAGYFASGADAVTVAEQGEMAATLQAPGLPAHMVVIEPGVEGTFVVSDPGIGGTYEVTAEWIEKYVSGGVWR
jgi:hypothetical protein